MNAVSHVVGGKWLVEPIGGGAVKSTEFDIHRKI